MRRNRSLSLLSCRTSTATDAIRPVRPSVHNAAWRTARSPLPSSTSFCNLLTSFGSASAASSRRRPGGYGTIHRQGRDQVVGKTLILGGTDHTGQGDEQFGIVGLLNPCRTTFSASAE